MAELLSFNRHRPPILPIELMDDANTLVNVVPPTVDLQEELRAMHAQLRVLLTNEDEEMVDVLYDLAARLMSCNRNLLKFTGESLRVTYRLDVEDLVVFYNAYSDFLTGIENAKN